MNTPVRLIVLAAVISAAAAHAQERQIYTWKDENGVVHYVDTPPDNPKAVAIDAPEAYRPGSTGAYPDDESGAGGKSDDSSAAGSDASSADGAGEEKKSWADQKREEIAKRREQRRAAEAEREQNCSRARVQLATLEPSRRVFFTNDQGETERMDDEERVRLVEEAKANVARYCGGTPD